MNLRTIIITCTKLFLSSLLCLQCAYGQSVEKEHWSWIGGDNTINNPGLYAKKEFDANNKPGGRGGAVSWTDTSGNLWMFGGYGHVFTGSNGYGLLNDLWQYNIAKSQWSWMGGDNTINNTGVYAKKDFDPGNKPGARGGAVSWTDANGNLWLFGGSGGTLIGYGQLNDLWQYNIVRNQWGWMNGDNSVNDTGRYVRKGPDPNNKPPARAGAVSWIDRSGNLWLFGGAGRTTNRNERLNDLWQYNIANKQWSWIGGGNTVNNAGVYVKEPDPKSQPGARSGAVSWIDRSGNLWLFGGDGYASNGFGNLNDLWQFNVATSQWIWIDGDNTVNNTGRYVRKGPDPNNKPGARYDAEGWIDKAGNLCLFGGDGYAANGNGELNDLWQYNIPDKQWSWISGDNSVNNPGNYVKKGPDPNNTPGARRDALSWTDKTGDLWLFGGEGYASTQDANGRLNDLWKFIPCTLPTGTLNLGNKTLCFGESINLAVTSAGNTAYQWYRNNDPVAGAIAANYTAKEPGIYKVRLYNAGGCTALASDSIVVKVNPAINATAGDIVHSNCTSGTGSATITATGGTPPFTYSMDGANFGALNKFDKLAPGNHKVTIRDNGGCTSDLNFTINQATSTLNATAGDIVPATCISSTGSVTITATGGTAPYTYGLDGGNFSALNKFDKLVPGRHNVIVRDNAGCTSNVGFDINRFNSTLTATAVDIIHSACTSNTGSATIAATGGSAPYTYSLDGGSFAAANKFDKLAPGKHNVTVRDSAACTFNLAIPVINATNPGITYSTVVVTPGQSYPLSVRANVANSYSWSPADGLNDPRSPSPTVTTSKDVRYLITMTAASGCITVDTQSVQVAKPLSGNVKDSVVAVPTAFTPNSNSVNDRLKPIPYSIRTLTYFKVFNRWGQLVFETQTVGVGWDGNFKGIPQPTESYTWILECISVSGTRIRRSGKSVLIR